MGNTLHTTKTLPFLLVGPVYGLQGSLRAAQDVGGETGKVLALLLVRCSHQPQFRRHDCEYEDPRYGPGPAEMRLSLQRSRKTTEERKLRLSVQKE